MRLCGGAFAGSVSLLEGLPHPSCIYGTEQIFKTMCTCTISLYCFLSMMQAGSGSPLYMASQFGHDDVVQLLLDGGARIDLPCKV